LCSLHLGTAGGRRLRRPVLASVPRASPFLRPFAPRPLRRFLATMNALTPARLSPAGQVSPVHPGDLPTLPSPTTPRSPAVAFARYPSARRASRIASGPGFAFHSQARRNARPNRVRLLRTGRLPPAASHPASRRRSGSWLRGWKASAPRGLSPPGPRNSRAHECGGWTPLCFRSHPVAFVESGVEPPHSKAFGAFQRNPSG
jgi:hypothetical protein